MRATFLLAVLVVAVPAGGATANTNDIFGNWERDDRAARVRVAACGDNICATNTWIKDPAGQKEKVGDRLIFTIKPNDNAWAGSGRDPQRGISFSATLKASGGSMVTTGCVVGGLICRSTQWTRM
ncbi:MAG: DUF2147 domain-containing protein [Pseudolabrys sp.]|nr:DUF2147 domain-containing protein [Pseudolabrys sp.]